VFFGLRYVQEGYGPRLTWRDKMRRCLSAGAHFPPLLVMDPIVARLFVERGMDTKQKLIDWCAENARLPAREYWDDQWIQTLLRPLAVAGVEPYQPLHRVAAALAVSRETLTRCLGLRRGPSGSAPKVNASRFKKDRKAAQFPNWDAELMDRSSAPRRREISPASVRSE
jgi:hypothetical protein